VRREEETRVVQSATGGGWWWWWRERKGELTGVKGEARVPVVHVVDHDGGALASGGHLGIELRHVAQGLVPDDFG